MAPASLEVQGRAQPERASRQRPSLRSVGATGFLLFRAAVVATFIAWFYVRILSGAISQRIPSGPPTRRLRGVRTLTFAMLVIALATAGTATVAHQRTANVESRPKVVVVVGPVGARTAEYEAAGRRLAAHARGLGARVTGIYPPRSTWSRVARAAQGADLLVYLGHGNGWPSPYPPFQTITKNGLGLNPYEGAPNGNHRYYGERYVRDLRLAKHSVVLLVGLCYSTGNSEPGMVIPSRRVAQERVDNYAAGFLRAGARAVFADGFGDSSYVLDGLFRSNLSMRGIFWSGWRATNVDASTFRSERVGGMTGILDPQVDGDYYHAFVGDADFRAPHWRGDPRPNHERAPGDQGSPGGGDDRADDRTADRPDDRTGDRGDRTGERDERPGDPPAQPAADRRRTTGHLHLRNGPGPSERILGYVSRGTEVLVLERRQQDGPPDWLRVRLPGGGEGWVWGQWVGGR